MPFPAGGPADLIARIIGQKLSEDFGKQFYVENHSGAGGNIGTGIGARAPADGYSLLVNSQAFVINASLYKSLPYDPEKDFAAVTRIATTPNVLVVHPSVPAKTVRELVELMRGSDARYHSYAQPGLGTPSHLSGELFRLSQKLALTAIPFGGGGPMIQSVVAGHTPVAFSSLPPASQQIQAGNLRALAVTAEKRVETLPDVPTMAEAGYPGQTRRDADRHSGPDRDARGDHRSPAPQDRRHRRARGCQAAACNARLLADRRHPGAIRGLPEGRGREDGPTSSVRPASRCSSDCLAPADPALPRSDIHDGDTQPRALEPRQHLGPQIGQLVGEIDERHGTSAWCRFCCKSR